jgi:hypothetical protein
MLARMVRIESGRAFEIAWIWAETLLMAGGRLQSDNIYQKLDGPS